MGYKKKKIISLDTDSALAVMQEIYNDIVEQKTTASQITKKMLAFMKDAEDMTMIGTVIDKQQKILQDCTEKKISLVKFIYYRRKRKALSYMRQRNFQPC